MRNRHFPRLCRSCHVPMARQEDSCWRCGEPWVTADATTVSPSAAPREDDRTEAARPLVAARS